MEGAIREKFPTLRIVYVRGEELSGHLAVSQRRIEQSLVDALVAAEIEVDGRKVSVKKCEGSDRDEFN